MPRPQHDEDVEPPAHAWPSRARQWRRAALGLALLFASLPLAGRLFLGTWIFDGAAGIAFLCLIAGRVSLLCGAKTMAPRPGFRRDTR